MLSLKLRIKSYEMCYTLVVDLIITVEAPFHVITNELFHQFRLMGVKKSAYCFSKNVLFVSKPALFNQHFDLIIKLLRHFSMNCSHKLVSPDTELKEGRRKLILLNVRKLTGRSCRTCTRPSMAVSRSFPSTLHLLRPYLTQIYL